MKYKHDQRRYEDKEEAVEINLLICDLFNDAVNTSVRIISNGRMTNEL
jgi:hypothetical protein